MYTCVSHRVLAFCFYFIHKTSGGIFRVTSAPSLWIILEAIAAIVGTIVLVAGLILARRYGRTAAGGVAGNAYPRQQGLVMSVRVSVRAVGLSRLRFSDDESSPTIRVTEVHTAEEELRDGESWTAKLVDMKEEVIDPGEEVSRTKLFPLPPPVDSLVGWRIEFKFGVGQTAHRWRRSRPSPWLWAEEVFVPRPRSVRVQLTHGNGY